MINIKFKRGKFQLTLIQRITEGIFLSIASQRKGEENRLTSNPKRNRLFNTREKTEREVFHLTLIKGNI